MQREAILHLVFPETFEYSLAPDDKRAIATAFGGLPGTAGADEDHALAVVRKEVEATIGEPLNLYADWFAPIWGRGVSGDWSDVLKWAKRLFEWRGFDEDERNYKLVLGGLMQRARERFETGGEWLPDLRAAFGGGNNLTNWRFEHGPFLTWCEEAPEAASGFLRRLWATDAVTAESLDAALALLPTDILRSPSARLTLTAYLLFGVDATRYPPYRVRALGKFKALLGEAAELPLDLDADSYTPGELAALLHVDPKRVRDLLREVQPRTIAEAGGEWAIDADVAHAIAERLVRGAPAGESAQYENFLALLDALRVRLLASGTRLRDRLDAQGIVWWLAGAAPPDSWDESEKSAFLAFQKGATVTVTGPVLDGDGFPLPSVSDDVAHDLYVPQDWLQHSVVDLLAEKKQIVLYGPPGTGKTFIAQKLAQDITRTGWRYHLIQFHPSYSYEDFFEGYRPVHGRRRHGRHATSSRRARCGASPTQAASDPDHPYVLIIDEINRGNIAEDLRRALLPARVPRRADRAPVLTATSRSRCPQNLFVIGTMNTADRSIALVDAALRRRFYFVALHPTRASPCAASSRRWLERHDRDDEPARLLVGLNDRIEDDELAIGPSYFMTRDGTYARSRARLAARILPLLEEHLLRHRTDVETSSGSHRCEATRRRGTDAAPPSGTTDGAIAVGVELIELLAWSRPNGDSRTSRPAQSRASSSPKCSPPRRDGLLASCVPAPRSASSSATTGSSGCAQAGRSRLMFLLGYARDPKGWTEHGAVPRASDDALLGDRQRLLVAGHRALDRGLLRGYVRTSKTAHVCAGGCASPIRSRAAGGLPLPLEVTYDDYTVDIAENRMLLTAAQLLLRLPRIPRDARRRLLRIRAILGEVESSTTGASVKAPPSRG